MTNYEYLKSLTIEELAKWLHELCDLNEIVPSEKWLSEFLKSEHVDETYYLDNRFDHKTLYSLKEVCDIAGISAEDLIKSDTPEIS